MNINDEIENEGEIEGNVETTNVKPTLAPWQVLDTRIQRGRTVCYTSFQANETGLKELVARVGAAVVVQRFVDFYIARNSVLSALDAFDGADYKGDKVFPWKGTAEEPNPEVIYFDLTENLPKPGERRTKWGDLKPYVEQTVKLLEGNGEKAPEKLKSGATDDEKAAYSTAADAWEARVRTVAGRLKEKADEQMKQMKNSLLA